MIAEQLRLNQKNRDLKRQINMDLEYFYQKNLKKVQEDIERTIKNVSPELRQKLDLEYNIKILNKMEIFTENFSKESIQEFASLLQEVNYFPNQIIYSDEIFDDSLIYIESGGVELFKQNDFSQLGITSNSHLLTKGQSFGQLSFFTGIYKDVYSISKGFTKVIKLSRSKFINVIRNKEKDFERFCEIKDNISLYEYQYELKQKCSLCGSFNHISFYCTRVHFNKKQSFWKTGIIQSGKQHRRECERRSQKKNSLKMLKIVYQTSFEFQDIRSFGNLDSIIKQEVKVGDDELSYISELNSQNYILSKNETKIEDSHTQISNNNPQNFKSSHKLDNDSLIFVQLPVQEKLQDELINFNPKGQQNFSIFLKSLSKQTNTLDFEHFNTLEILEKKDNKEGSDIIVKSDEGFSDTVQNLIRNGDKQKKRNSQQHQVSKMKQYSSPQVGFDYKKLKSEDRQEIIKSLHNIIQNKGDQSHDKEDNDNNAFPWFFEQLKDFKFYFVLGNSKYQIPRIQRTLNKLKRQRKKPKKTLINFQQI